MVAPAGSRIPTDFFRSVCFHAVWVVVLVTLPGCVCSSGASGYEVQGEIVLLSSGERITSGTIQVVLESSGGPVEIVSPNDSTLEAGRFVVLLATTQFDGCGPILLDRLFPQHEIDIPDVPVRATVFVQTEEEEFTASVEIDSSALVGVGTSLVFVDLGRVSMISVVD